MRGTYQHAATNYLRFTCKKLNYHRVSPPLFGSMSVKNWYVNKGIRSEIEVLAIGGEGVNTSVLKFQIWL